MSTSHCGLLIWMSICGGITCSAAQTTARQIKNALYIDFPSSPECAAYDLLPVRAAVFQVVSKCLKHHLRWNDCISKRDECMFGTARFETGAFMDSEVLSSLSVVFYKTPHQNQLYSVLETRHQTTMEGTFLYWAALRFQQFPPEQEPKCYSHSS